MTKLTDKNYHRLILAINKAKRNGWEPSSWPIEDTKFELDCCYSVGDLLWNKSFQKALGSLEWKKLITKMVGGKEIYLLEK